MTPEQYMKAAARTEADAAQQEAAKARLADLDPHVLHAALGMVTEAAEVADWLKRHIFYGAELDQANLVEELGDQQWYQNLMMRARGVTLAAVHETNIAKINKRFPGKFTENNALHRDLDGERKLLESHSPDGARWLVQWVVGPTTSDFTLRRPWKKTVGGCFAAIIAKDATEARAKVVCAYEPKPEDLRFVSITKMPADWAPFDDGFKRENWMEWMQWPDAAPNVTPEKPDQSEDLDSPDAPNAPNADALASAELLLRKIRTGEITGFFVAATDSDDAVHELTGGRVNLPGSACLLQVLQHRALDAWASHFEQGHLTPVDD